MLALASNEAVQQTDLNALIRRLLYLVWQFATTPSPAPEPAPATTTTTTTSASNNTGGPAPAPVIPSNSSTSDFESVPMQAFSLLSYILSSRPELIATFYSLPNKEEFLRGYVSFFFFFDSVLRVSLCRLLLVF